jgi:hypothetical protein
MAHYAKIENGIVTNVIVVCNEVVGDYPASDAIGQAFITSINLHGDWLQTSYNNNFRKQYAGIGFTYDADADEFVQPQPFPSWTLDSNNDWQAPTSMPDNGKMYSWNEASLAWVEVDF